MHQPSPSASPPPSPHRRAGSFLERSGLAAVCVFLALILWRAPYADPQDFDYDEGINLVKTMLYSRGYTLYEDIWSDQPPLLTVLLAGWMDWVGTSVAAARALIVLFTTLLVWSLYVALRRSASVFAAGTALVLLLLSEYFLRLSGAVMVGMPSLAVATAAAALAVVAGRRLWLIVLSGVLMALALQIKLIVALAVPALLLHLLFGLPPAADEDAGRARHALAARLVPPLLWLVGLGIPFFALGWLFGALDFDLLLGTHLGSQTQGFARFIAESAAFLPHFFLLHTPNLVLAGVGSVWALRRRERAIILPLAWFLTTLLTFTFYRPLWYHHVLLLNVPLAWLAGFGVELWVQGFQGLTAGLDEPALRRRSALLVASAVLTVVGVLAFPTALQSRQAEQMRLNRPNYLEPIAEQLRSDALDQPGWVFTDRPFYAFRAGLPVPPPVAVLSRKRMETGQISEQTMLDVLATYEPQYVVLERFTDSYGARFMEEVRRRYELVLDHEPALYFRIRDE